MRSLSIVSSLALALLLAGCKSEEEKTLSSAVDKMNEVVSILKTIKDDDSAKAAGPKLQAVGAEMKQLQQKSLSQKPDEAEKKRLIEKYQPQMKSAAMAIKDEELRISKDPKLQTPEVLKALSSLQSGMW